MGQSEAQQPRRPAGRLRASNPRRRHRRPSVEDPGRAQVFQDWMHEDVQAAWDAGYAGQGTTMSPGTENRRILHGRQENQTIHDENGMRHYYEEWGRWVNRSPSAPDQPYSARQGGVVAAE